jgi:RNA polymerase sigma factor (sigma-70 family)
MNRHDEQPYRIRVDELLPAAAAGDADAWDEIFRAYTPVVRAVVHRYRVPPAVAADVCQTVWARLLENAHRIRDPRCLPSWLATTTRRECMRVLRGDAVQYPVDDLTEHADPAPSPEDRCVRASRDRLLRQAIGRLPERDQRLLGALMEDPRPSYRAVSAIVPMPVGSIGPTRARALARLRGEFARLGVTEYRQIA